MEEITIRTLTAYYIALNDPVKQYRGIMVDTPRDTILAKFSSVADLEEVCSNALAISQTEHQSC